MRALTRNSLLSLMLLTACSADIEGIGDTGKPADGPGVVPGARPFIPPQKVGEIREALIESPHDLGPNTSHTEEVFEPGATFIKVHFGLLGLAPGDELIISDAAGNVVDRFYADAGTDDEWAIRVPGDTALVTLNTGAAPQREGFAIDKFSKGIVPLASTIAEEVEPEGGFISICGVDDKKAAACFDGTIAQKSQAVGQMTFTTGDGQFVCTGSLISANNHFITNNHCIANQADTNSLEVTFNFQNSTCTGTTLATTTVVRGGTFLKTSAPLDYTLVQLNGNPAATFGFLEIDARNLTTGEAIYIPQHPGGRRKEIAVTENGVNCSIKAINQSISGFTTGANAGYTCDTEGGSSGSPVLSATSHKLVALHHLGGCNNSGTYLRNIFPEIQSFLGTVTPPPPPPAPGQGFFTGNAAGLPKAIPDNNTTGAAGTFSVPSGVVASKIVLEVNATHTFRGDLVATLTAPGGQVATFSNRAGGSADNLTGTFDLTSAFPAGLNATGTWTVKIVDAASADTGTFNSAKLTINTPPASNTFVGQNTTASAIPDNNTTGITSVISASGVTTVNTVQVELNITHTFRGDLTVTLTNPAGVSQTVIAPASSDSADNIVGKFSVTGFTGSGNGNWTLKVVDKAGADLGTLNFWKLGLNATL